MMDTYFWKGYSTESSKDMKHFRLKNLVFNIENDKSLGSDVKKASVLNNVISWCVKDMAKRVLRKEIDKHLSADLDELFCIVKDNYIQATQRETLEHSRRVGYAIALSIVLLAVVICFKY